MSVSEKLRALEADVETIREVLTEALACDALDRIAGTLPELLAVVEAAERIRKLAEPHPSQAVLFVIADAALAALDAKLTMEEKQ